MNEFSKTDIKVKRAVKTDIPLVGDILGDAFNDDPVLNWIISEAEGYKAYFRNTCKYLFIMHNEVYLTQKETGAALWLPPGISASKVPFIGLLKLFCLAVKYGGFKGVKRCTLVLNFLDKNHYKKPHYYLHAIGVRKPNRKTGIGSVLLNTILKRCDNENIPAYLENTNESNLSFYYKHRFEIIVKKSPCQGCPPVWFMLREPENT